jgi:hypothetical protein
VKNRFRKHTPVISDFFGSKKHFARQIDPDLIFCTFEDTGRNYIFFPDKNGRHMLQPEKYSGLLFWEAF